MKFRVDSLITTGFLLVFVIGVVMARDWPFATRLFPWAAGIPAILLSLAQLVYEVRSKGERKGSSEGRMRVDDSGETGLSADIEIPRILGFFCWLIGVGIGTWLLSLPVAMMLFVFTYTLFQGKERWWLALLVTGVTYLFVIVLFENILVIPWPQGALLDWLGW